MKFKEEVGEKEWWGPLDSEKWWGRRGGQGEGANQKISFWYFSHQIFQSKWAIWRETLILSSLFSPNHSTQRGRWVCIRGEKGRNRSIQFITSGDRNREWCGGERPLGASSPSSPWPSLAFLPSYLSASETPSLLLWLRSWYQLGSDAVSRLVELEPCRSAGYLLASSMYAAGGWWSDAARMRWLLKERGVRMVAGYSLVHVSSNNKAFKFVAGDNNNKHYPFSGELCLVNEQLHSCMKFDDTHIHIWYIWGCVFIRVA